MTDYELVVILEPGLKREDKEKVLKKIAGWVKKGKGGIKEEKEWGLRNFAYPIQKKNEGLYCIYNLQAEGNLDKIFQEEVKLEKKILRYLLVKVRN